MSVWSRFKKTLRSGRHNAEIQEELEFHLSMDAARGQSNRGARARLGNLTRIGEETRAAGIFDWLDSAWQDARYGLRQLGKTPALAAAVVLSIAIGVGANTAIFTLVDAALLKPLPVKQPDALRIIQWSANGFPADVENINGDFGPGPGGRVLGSSISAALYRKLAAEQTAYAALIGAADPNTAAATIDARPAEQVSLQYVSANFFQGLGVPLTFGRGFRVDEDRVGEQPGVVVSGRFWREKLGGAADSRGNVALEHSIRINNVPARIVGVAPDGFFGLRPGGWVDIYTPLAARVEFQPAAAGQPRTENDRDWWVRMMARLRPDVPETAARGDAARLFRNLIETPSADPKSLPELVSMPGRRGLAGLNSKDAGALRILTLLVGVLLLLVCANVANLLLAKSVDRQRESAVRLALGAARSRLFRQHWIESGFLALLGGAAGLGLGYLLAQSLHMLFEAGRGPGSAFDLHISLRVLGYTSALSVITAFLFGLAPAVRAARVDLQHALKTQTRSVMGGRMRFPRALVCVQIALCLSALVAAGLLGRTLGNLKGLDVGFERRNLAYATVNPGQAGYTSESVPGYRERLQEQLGRIPGVTGVSPVEVRLVAGNGNFAHIVVPGQAVRIQRGIIDPSEGATLNHVGEAFFTTLRIPLLAGRTFEPRDLRAHADQAVVDETFARRFFPNRNPIGQRFYFGSHDPDGHEIVGVVRATRYRDLRGELVPNVFEPLAPSEFRGAAHFAMRTSIDPKLLAEAVRRAVASVDPAVPLIAFRTQDELIDGVLRTERLLSFVSGAFGLVALALAAIGLGGLLAYAVARRTNEIGVRMALGAAAGDVIGMVLRDSLWMAAGGILLGLPCAYAVGRVLETSLFQLQPVDPLTGVLAFATLLTVALLAAWIPARRAARIEPVMALRE
jgi:predicted permease